MTCPASIQISYIWEQTGGPLLDSQSVHGEWSGDLQSSAEGGFLAIPVAGFIPALAGTYRFKLTVAGPALDILQTDDVTVTVRAEYFLRVHPCGVESFRGGGEVVAHSVAEAYEKCLLRSTWSGYSPITDPDWWGWAGFGYKVINQFTRTLQVQSSSELVLHYDFKQAWEDSGLGQLGYEVTHGGVGIGVFRGADEEITFSVVSDLGFEGKLDSSLETTLQSVPERGSIALRMVSFSPSLSSDFPSNYVWKWRSVNIDSWAILHYRPIR